MNAMLELDNAEWSLIRDLFDPRGRRGRAATYPRPEVIEAILFLARTGCQWRYLPDRYPPWEAVWQQWRRWRDSGVWARAMTRLHSGAAVAPPGSAQLPAHAMASVPARIINPFGCDLR